MSGFPGGPVRDTPPISWIALFKMASQRGMASIFFAFMWYREGIDETPLSRGGGGGDCTRSLHVETPENLTSRNLGVSLKRSPRTKANRPDGSSHDPQTQPQTSLVKDFHVEPCPEVKLLLRITWSWQNLLPLRFGEHCSSYQGERGFFRKDSLTPPGMKWKTVRRGQILGANKAQEESQH